MAMIRHIQFGLSTVLLAVLAACGGGDDDPVVTKVPVTSLRVMGDSLAELRSHKELANMRTLAKGNRLSITPVDPAEWKFITEKLM